MDFDIIVSVHKNFKVYLSALILFGASVAQNGKANNNLSE
jgi:hypothetical protein